VAALLKDSEQTAAAFASNAWTPRVFDLSDGPVYGIRSGGGIGEKIASAMLTARDAPAATAVTSPGV
jgi:hypothetical protein